MTPEESMREGVRSLLKMHYPKDNGVRQSCMCGDWEQVRGIPQSAEWSEHVAEIIAKAFPPATLEVTDTRARIESALTTLTEWTEGRRGIQTDDPAQDAIIEAMVAVKNAALVFALVQSEKAHG